jgi:hypothetical protein
MWWLSQDKQLLIFESRGDSNRCSPYRGKSDTHDTYVFCASPHMPLVHFLWVVPVQGNIWRWPNRVGRTLLHSRKMAPDTILSMLADRSIGPPPSFSPITTIEAVMKTKHMLMNRLHRFIGPISPACDQYVQYLLVEPTHRSLTDIGGDYNLGGASLPHHTPCPSQPTVHRFPPKGSTRSQVNHPTITTKLKREQTLNLTSGTPPL